jgi:hypothetical protein
MDGAPGADTPLNRPANARPKFGMTPDHLVEDGDRSNAGSCPQHRHDLGFKNIGERVGTASFPRRLLL